MSSADQARPVWIDESIVAAIRDARDSCNFESHRFRELGRLLVAWDAAPENAAEAIDDAYHANVECDGPHTVALLVQAVLRALGQPGATDA